jgi:hypothetical protein
MTRFNITMITEYGSVMTCCTTVGEPVVKVSVDQSVDMRNLDHQG